MPSDVQSYRDLLVWQRAIDLAVQTYRLTQSYPREEQYGLTSQSRRAAASIAANIAEGYGRATRPAYLSFLRIARGSLKELETHLMLAMRVELTTSSAADAILDEADQLGRMLQALIAKLEKHPGR